MFSGQLKLETTGAPLCAVPGTVADRAIVNTAESASNVWWIRRISVLLDGVVQGIAAHKAALSGAANRPGARRNVASRMRATDLSTRK
jgi:hypothetical protein